MDLLEVLEENPINDPRWHPNNGILVADASNFQNEEICDAWNRSWRAIPSFHRTPDGRLTYWETKAVINGHPVIHRVYNN